MSETFRDLKISDFVGKLSATFRGLREMEAQLVNMIPEEPRAHSTESTNIHGDQGIGNLETRLKDLEIMCSILSSREVLSRVQKILRDKQRKRRKRAFEQTKSTGPMDEVTTIPFSAGSSTVRVPSEIIQKTTKSKQPTSKSAKQRKRRLKKISQLYERMQRYRQLYNIRVPENAQDSPFLCALDDLESRLKLLRQHVTRRAGPIRTDVKLNLEDIPLPSEPPGCAWKSEITSLLFGTNEETLCTSTKLQPQTVGDLLEVRRQWDQFVTDGVQGSGIPRCYVLPPQNPSEEWKSHRRDPSSMSG